jgi:hypothetical protein
VCAWPCSRPIAVLYHAEHQRELIFSIPLQFRENKIEKSFGSKADKAYWNTMISSLSLGLADL